MAQHNRYISPFSTRYASDEISYCLDLADVEVLVFGPEFIGRIESVAEKLAQILQINAESILKKMERTDSQYEVLKLDLVSRTALAVPFYGNYYTVPSGTEDTRILQTFQKETFKRMRNILLLSL